MTEAENDDDQARALAVLNSGAHAFLTGDAGTGKSWVVHRYLETQERLGRDVLVTASTGVAAMLLPGGQTLHSAVGLGVHHAPMAPPDPHPPMFPAPYGLEHAPDVAAWLAAEADVRDGGDSKLCVDSYKARARKFLVERLREADAIVLDEVSMIDARTLDHAAWLVARTRGDRAKDRRTRRPSPDAPFGGLQVVLVGDLAQLPPVEGDRWGWACDSAAWRDLAPTVVSLTKVRRQADAAFAGLLSRLRLGALAGEDARTLLSRVGAFDPRTATRVLPTNRECDAANARELAALPGRTCVSAARDFALPGLEFLLKRFDEGCPSPKELRVKVGARVLLTANDEGRRYANGTAAVLREVGVPRPPGDAAAFAARKRFRTSLHDMVDDGNARGVTVTLESGEDVWLGRHAWTIEEKGRLLASREQYPLRLGWAITAHRAQGATLARASVSLENCFSEGQAYVALSRAKSLDGLNLESARLGLVAAHPRFLQFERERNP